ncbi:hypothetical protein [Aureibaculum conchae]|uniref:hypothetical protein n=1 Tax=Aureibaculum sp. 2308TA14-22 TaxID=3108392 RepID=UPI003399D15B
MSNRVLEITRTKQYANKARAIGIYINNKKVGTIKDGETKIFILDAEENEVYAKIDWCQTEPQKISTKENETTILKLGSNLSGWKLLLAFYYITVNSSELLYLKEIN